MLKAVIAKAIENRKVTIFFVLLAVIFGLYSYYLIPKQENPDMNVPVAMITVTYPGASPEEIEKNVTGKIEDELTGINGFDYCESYSRNSLSKVIIWLENDADVEKAWSKLRQKMDDLEGKLPAGCSAVEVNTELAETAGMIISLSGDNYSYEELAYFAEEIKKELAVVKGVSRFEVSGKQEKEVHVEIDTACLNQTRLSLEDVSQILAAQNTEIPPGNIQDGGTKIGVQAPGKFTSLEDIRNTILDVSPENGSVLRVRDIARVSLEDEDGNCKIRENGENAVLLTGYFQDNKNIVLVGKEVKERLDSVRKRLPQDLKVDEVIFQPRDIHESVTDFMKNLVLGMVIVALVVFFGMGMRNASIISTAIPLSILIAFGSMGFLGLKIHQITIAGLIIALGMLVDNAIVISDAIQVRLDREEERMQACVLGTKDVAIPVLSSTLTTVAAYIPLATLPGVAGDYIRGIPQVVIISLSASYLVALLFTPTMAFLFFKKGKREARIFLFWRYFKALLDKALAKKRGMFAVIAAALVFTLLLALNLPLVFFPKDDKNIVYINISAEKAADLSKTEELVKEVEEVLREQKEVVKYTSAVGSGLPKFFMTVPLAIQSPDFGQVLIQLDLREGKRFGSNTEFADYLQQVLDERIAGGTATVKQLELAEPVEAPVQVLVTGERYESVSSAAERLKEMLGRMEGTINVRDDGSDEFYEYEVEIDTGKAALLGLTRFDIQREINAALEGKTASVFRQGGEEYDIIVKGDIKTKEELENLAVKAAATGNKALIKQVAEIKLASELPTIKRYNRERTIKVLSDVKPGYSAVTTEDRLEQELRGLDLSDVRVVFNGEREKIRYHFGNLGTASVFAALIIYLIMLIQFNSLVQPLIIMTTIPLSAIGSVIGLFLFRQPLSFMALLGVVSLIGVVVNNAIIMLDYINSERSRGMEMEEACRSAVEKRFRPILMTTATTVLGLIPLAMSGTLFVPMAVSLMSGLVVATLLTMVVIPAVYAVAEGKKIINAPPREF
ncbi:MAG: efflux RND transporter permease subunit [Peptococcaceae bacterium]|jgi:multidrug efflux pump subunit AcrB|nr:efflux RND transporter permease subunit [Peptococcaceae bacterium]MDH7523960.1 efflux RND transporter permease subunit [Peptococcaceae bacterium]